MTDAKEEVPELSLRAVAVIGAIIAVTIALECAGAVLIPLEAFLVRCRDAWSRR